MEEKDYFTLEPEDENHAQKLTITDFNINLTNRELAKIENNGRMIKGLVKILVTTSSSNGKSSSDSYNIHFRGNIKKNGNIPKGAGIEIKRYKETSLDSKKRIIDKKEKKNESISYFPKEELEKTLKNNLNGNNSEVSIKDLKRFIYEILSKKRSISPKELIKVYTNPAWNTEIHNFMFERSYLKDGNKYVTKQK